MRRFVLMPRHLCLCDELPMAQSRLTLAAPFVQQALATPGESRFDLRFFTTVVRTHGSE